MIATDFPADASALVAAASRIEGEDPEAVMAGAPSPRARVYAFIALAHRYPGTKHSLLMIACGADPVTAQNRVVTALQAARGDRRCRWFSVDRLNAIVTTIGWEPMTRTDSEIRRKGRTSQPDESVSVVAFLIAGFMGQVEAARAELVQRDGRKIEAAA